MGGMNACYRGEDGSLQNCGGEMFGANAPASTWHMTFDHANLGKNENFVPVPGDSPFNSQGDGTVVKQPKKKKKGGNGAGGNGNGPGNPNTFVIIGGNTGATVAGATAPVATAPVIARRRPPVLAPAVKAPKRRR